MTDQGRNFFIVHCATSYPILGCITTVIVNEAGKDCQVSRVNVVNDHLA